MTKLDKFIAITSLLLVVLHGSNGSYDGHEVWRLSHQPGIGNKVVNLLEELSLDVWGANPVWTDVRVSPDQIKLIGDIIQSFNLDSRILIEDVGRLISSSHQRNNDKPFTRDGSRADFDFTRYHTLDEMMAFLDVLAAESEYVTLAEVGRTVENRELRTVTISVPSSSNVTKPVVWIDCGIHAREWITPITCLYGLNGFVEYYSVDHAITNFLDAHDLVMLPVVNPDGYEYTWTDDRLWRKNRNLWSGNQCVGTDLNRNYDDGHWGEIGASANSCAETYHGPTPFSEIESSTVRDTILDLQSRGDVKSLFSIHSYGQLWLFAFGWTSTLPAESDELFRVSQVGVDKIYSQYGTTFTNGPHYETIYPAAGTALDWGYSVGIVHTYITELRDTGESGFILPEDQIVPTATETWKGIVDSIMAI